MGLFGNRQPPPPPARCAACADLEAEVASLRKRVVTAEQTVADVADRAYRWMKKSEARSRRELDESGATGQVDGVRERATVATPPSSRRARVWGARGRMGRFPRTDPSLEIVPDTGTGG